jgi:hypothetical protein
MFKVSNNYGEKGSNATHCSGLAKKNERRKPTKEESKKKSHYMSLHESLKTAEKRNKNF